MNKLFKFTLYLLSIITLILITTNTDDYQIKTYSNSNTTYLQPDFITNQQTKAQVRLFKEALDQFGANSPEQVVDIWVNAEKTRNGVFHYAVACSELKDKIIEEWGKADDSFWIYGGSSPWLDKYEILYNKKLSESEYEVKIKFFWITSAGPSKPSETILSIVKDKDIWCVKETR